MTQNQKNGQNEPYNPVVRRLGKDQENDLRIGQGLIIVGITKNGPINFYPKKDEYSFLDRIFNPVREYCEIDSKEFDVTLDFKSATNQPGIYFLVSIRFGIGVTNGADFIRSNVTDMRAYVERGLQRRAAEVLEGFAKEQAQQARAKIKEVLDEYEPDGDFLRFTLGHVEVTPDEDVLKLIRECELVELEKNLHTKRVELQQHANKELRNPDFLRAQYLRTKDATYATLLKEVMLEITQNDEQKIQIAKFLIDQGVIEPMDVHRQIPTLAPHLLKTLMGNHLGQLAGEDVKKLPGVPAGDASIEAAEPVDLSKNGGTS